MNYTNCTAALNLNDSNLTTIKKKSMALNINNMKGIDLRKAIKSKTVNACTLI